MKSLYFQTVGMECKFYENQQLEYRLFFLGVMCYDVLIGFSRKAFIFRQTKEETCI